MRRPTLRESVLLVIVSVPPSGRWTWKCSVVGCPARTGSHRELAVIGSVPILLAAASAQATIKVNAGPAGQSSVPVSLKS